MVVSTFAWFDTKKPTSLENWWAAFHALILKSGFDLGGGLVRNPWFPDVLEQERKDALNNEQDQYDHVWEGGYVTVSSGAYFAKHLAKAKSQGRITDVPEDPLLIVRLYADIGGTGAKSDNFVFWAAQFQGLKINFINHYESQGQPIGAHINWLRSQDYTPDRVKIWLPHDGETNDKVLDINYRKAFESAGYKVEVVKNQGAGAAKARIEQARNLFPKMWFDHKCQGGIEALGWYHEKRDPNRNIGLGPEHDWSSHSADAFGLAAIAYEEPKAKKEFKQPTIGMA